MLPNKKSNADSIARALPDGKLPNAPICADGRRRVRRRAAPRGTLNRYARPERECVETRI